MIFQYKSEDGELIEKDFPFGEAPPKSVKEKGKTYNRFYGPMNVVFGESFRSDDQIKFKRGPIQGDYEYI